MTRLFRIKAVLPDGEAERFNLDCAEHELFTNVRSKISDILKDVSYKLFWKDEADLMDGRVGTRLRGQEDMSIALEDNGIESYDEDAPVLEIYVELLEKFPKQTDTMKAESEGEPSLKFGQELDGLVTQSRQSFHEFVRAISSPHLDLLNLRKKQRGTKPGIISFSGRDWIVKPSTLSKTWKHDDWEADNNWAENNVWVDDNGLLHMKLSLVDGKWFGAYLWSSEKLSFGHYQFQVEGRIDKLDHNAVFWLCSRRSPAEGQEGLNARTNEIGIEFANWGDPNCTPAMYSVFPPVEGVDRQVKAFGSALYGGNTTHSIEWSPDRVVFASMHGHQNLEKNGLYGQWNYRPTAEGAEMHIPHKPQEVCMALCLYNGLPPSDAKEVVILVHSFRFFPLST